MPNRELECCTMSYREFRLRCPYGLWSCTDGREVIFNRDYWPILERRPGEKAKPANPNEWIWGIRAHDYFFDDANPPWGRRRRVAADTLARCNRVLAAWGFPALPKPTPPKPLAICATSHASILTAGRGQRATRGRKLSDNDSTCNHGGFANDCEETIDRTAG
jgi:hypothetical protein